MSSSGGSDKVGVGFEVGKVEVWEKKVEKQEGGGRGCLKYTRGKTTWQSHGNGRVATSVNEGRTQKWKEQLARDLLHLSHHLT